MVLAWELAARQAAMDVIVLARSILRYAAVVGEVEPEQQVAGLAVLMYK